MTNKPKANLAEIKLLVMDVDGILTDGSIVINGDGSESKTFNVLDGHGIRMWQRAGLIVVSVASGRDALERLFETIHREAEQQVPGQLIETGREFWDEGAP